MMGKGEIYSLSCRDIGIDDDFVTSGKTRSDVMTRMIRYVFRVHGIDPLELRLRMIHRMSHHSISH